MLDALGDDPLAIGYVPQTWLAKANPANPVHSLQVDAKLVEKLHQPVLAFTRAEPVGPLRQLLVCLQSAGH
jgi:hypothetical protein